MARPPLAIGTHGKVSSKEVEPGHWKAWTRFRDHDGHTRLVERWGHGKTDTKARTALREALRERSGAGAVTLTGASRFEDAASVWIEQIKLKRRVTTYDTYSTYLRSLVLPAVGKLLLRECTVSRLQDFMDSLERQGVAGNTRRSVRKVLRGVIQVAVRREVLTHNPARELDAIEGNVARPVAYDAAELREFLTRMDADKTAARTGLGNLIRFLFGTGCRIGEALGLRWCDVNLGDEPLRVVDPVAGVQVIPPRSLWINGNIVPVRGEGVRRHSGKTFAANRVLALPDFLHTMLLVLRPAVTAETDPVFPSLAGGWLHPNTVQKSVRRLRDRIGHPEFTTHVGRKTVASALDGDRQTARQIADQLGQANVAVTQNRYLARGLRNPAAAAAIDQLHRGK